MAVIVAVFLVVVTGVERLDPIIALLVAANIIWTGVRRLRQTGLGLLDSALPAADQARITSALAALSRAGDRVSRVAHTAIWRASLYLDARACAGRLERAAWTRSL